jgi:hypothetical protein
VADTDIAPWVSAIDFRTNRVGLATGASALDRSTDGGSTWEPVKTPPDGSRYDVAWWSDQRGDTRASVPDLQKIVFAVGSSGSDVSLDRGRNWEEFDGGSFNAVDCVQRTLVCWAAGNGGRAARLAVG